MPAHNVVDGGGNKEVLLAQPQLLPLRMVVVGVQHLADSRQLGNLPLGSLVIAAVEGDHVELGGHGLEQPQGTDRLAVIAGNQHVAGHGRHGLVIGMDNKGGSILPVLGNFSAETDLHRVGGLLLKPHIAVVVNPVVGQLGLPAVLQLLAEDAVLVADRVAPRRILAGGQRVEEAGRKPAQPPVADARVRLKLEHILQLKAAFLHNLLHRVVHAEIVQVVAQRAANKELHADVVHPLALLRLDFFGEAHFFAAHQLLQHGAQHAVHLLRGGVFQIGIVQGCQFIGKDARQILFGKVNGHINHHLKYLGVELVILYRKTALTASKMKGFSQIRRPRKQVSLKLLLYSACGVYYNKKNNRILQWRTA